jgi:transcription initiation factor IIE alpha subunit
MWQFFCGLKTASQFAQHIEYLLSLSEEIANLQRAESADIKQILHEIESIRVIIIEKQRDNPQKTYCPNDENDCLNN